MHRDTYAPAAQNEWENHWVVIGRSSFKIILNYPINLIVNYQRINPYMRNLLTITIIVVLIQATINNNPPSTKITFFVEHEVDPKSDYLEIVMEVKAEDTSLNEALAEGA